MRLWEGPLSAGRHDCERLGAVRRRAAQQAPRRKVRLRRKPLRPLASPPNRCVHVESEAAAFADDDAVPVGALIWQAGAFRVEDWPVPRVSVMAAATVGSQRQVEIRLGSSDPGLPQRFAPTVTEPDREIEAFAIHRNGLSRMQSMAATPLDAGARPIISLAPPSRAATPAPSPCGTAPRANESCPPFSALEFRKPEPPPPDAPGNFRAYRAESQGKKVTTESLRFDLGAKGQKGDVTGPDGRRVRG